MQHITAEEVVRHQAVKYQVIHYKEEMGTEN